ncbi:MAG: hypothetical protein M5U34_11310 [Chloroflexi bacterium]|nr:hypothetical protein [Chloroflexota bacterium]
MRMLSWKRPISNPTYNHINFVGLVFNQRGYERALAAGCRAMAFGVAVSDTFSQRNTRRASAEALATTRALVAQAGRDGIWTRVYLMTAWVCPFEGKINPLRTIALAEQVWALGIDELAVADTIGHADPLAVGSLMENLGRRLDMSRLAVHLHDTQAIGLANATTALQAGVRIFDSSVGGLGGCPFAPGAAGNLATEDLVFLAYKLGLGTGVDFESYGTLWMIWSSGWDGRLAGVFGPGGRACAMRNRRSYSHSVPVLCAFHALPEVG